MMSRLEKEFKETELGWIPEDWDISNLEDLTIKITDGAHHSPPTFEGGYPIATVENMEYSSINVSACRTISSEDFELLKRNSCSPEYGDVLLSKDGTIGKTFVYKQKDEIVLLSSIAIIRNNKNALLPQYLMFFLQSPYFYWNLERLRSGSAIKRIVLKDIKRVLLPIPSLKEQQKIASILSSVDEVIEKTEAIIEQTERVKNGLMQQLFTKGIGHTTFKKTEIGDIPKDWELKTLEEILEVCQYGLSDALSLEKKGFPVLRMGNLQNGIIDTENLKYLDVPEGNVKDFLLENGDILFNRTNSEELVGKTSIFQEDFPCSFASYLIRLRPKKNQVDSHFLNYYMNSGAGQNRIRRYIALGVSQCNISASNLKKVYMPIPNIEEQNKIVNIVCSSDKKIEVEKRRLSQLQKLKQGLMQSLLTGIVRVKVDETEVTQV